MARLITIDEFENELEEIAKTHPEDAGLFDALIEQMMDDEELVAELFKDVPKWHFMHKPSVEIKRFQACWDTGRRVYLLKVYGEDSGHLPYRMFAGHDVQTNDYVMLSVQPRDTSYDTNDTGFRELCDRYDRERIPAFKRNT